MANDTVPVNPINVPHKSFPTEAMVILARSLSGQGLDSELATQLAQAFQPVFEAMSVSERQNYDVIERAALPTGSIVPYTSTVAPRGYLLADGSAVNRNDYSALFKVVGVTFGAGDGLTTFNIPNVKGRVIAGQDAGQAEFLTLGQTGGAKTVGLVLAEMPAHQHSVTANGLSHPFAAGGTNTQVPAIGANDRAFPITDIQGSGTAHQNLSPYMVLPYLIKT